MRAGRGFVTNFPRIPTPCSKASSLSGAKKQMIDFREWEVWFATGSQHLYGEKTLKEVAKHAQEITRGLANLPRTPVRIITKPVLTTPESIHALCLEANHAKACIGLIVWMHTFSPAKMWIPGLKALQKPF